MEVEIDSPSALGVHNWERTFQRLQERKKRKYETLESESERLFNGTEKEGSLEALNLSLNDESNFDDSFDTVEPIEIVLDPEYFTISRGGSVSPPLPYSRRAKRWLENLYTLGTVWDPTSRGIGKEGRALEGAMIEGLLIDRRTEGGGMWRVPIPGGPMGAVGPTLTPSASLAIERSWVNHVFHPFLLPHSPAPPLPPRESPPPLFPKSQSQSQPSQVGSALGVLNFLEEEGREWVEPFHVTVHRRLNAAVNAVSTPPPPSPSLSHGPSQGTVPSPMALSSSLLSPSQSLANRRLLFQGNSGKTFCSLLILEKRVGFDGILSVGKSPDGNPGSGGDTLRFPLGNSEEALQFIAQLKGLYQKEAFGTLVSDSFNPSPPSPPPGNPTTPTPPTQPPNVPTSAPSASSLIHTFTPGGGNLFSPSSPSAVSQSSQGKGVTVGTSQAIPPKKKSGKSAYLSGLKNPQLSRKVPSPSQPSPGMGMVPLGNSTGPTMGSPGTPISVASPLSVPSGYSFSPSTSHSSHNPSRVGSMTMGNMGTMGPVGTMGNMGTMSAMGSMSGVSNVGNVGGTGVGKVFTSGTIYMNNATAPFRQQFNWVNNPKQPPKPPQ